MDLHETIEQRAKLQALQQRISLMPRTQRRAAQPKLIQLRQALEDREAKLGIRTEAAEAAKEQPAAAEEHTPRLLAEDATVKIGDWEQVRPTRPKKRARPRRVEDDLGRRGKKELATGEHSHDPPPEFYDPVRWAARKKREAEAAEAEQMARDAQQQLKACEEQLELIKQALQEELNTPSLPGEAEVCVCGLLLRASRSGLAVSSRDDLIDSASSSVRNCSSRAPALHSESCMRGL